MKSLQTKLTNLILSSLSIITFLVFVYMLFSLQNIIDTNEKSKLLKEDYTQLHSVQYGLFNSNIWADKIATIIDRKIDNFNFTNTSRKQIKKYVETILDTLIVEADRSIREKNRRKKGFFDTLLGSTKQIVTDSLIDIKSLRKKVPEFTDTIMNELERPINQKLLKDVIRKKLHELTKDNLSNTDMTQFDAIVSKYHTNSFQECSEVLNRYIDEKEESLNNQAMDILIMASIIMIIIILQGGLVNSISLLLLSLTSITLLVGGITLPMLEIEAKIDKLYFTILNQSITFNDQILFFKSKSIYDLAYLLIKSNDNKMMFVGVLLTTFSIIFPSLKIISTYIYYYFRGIISDNFIIRFFALYSTKWSMADVMVVSIFMAYLGLDSIISDQLRKLTNESAPINVITTNGTHLEVGFYLFLGFVLSSFVLSTLLGRKKRD